MKRAPRDDPNRAGLFGTARLASTGFSLVAAVVVGLLLGIGIAKLAHFPLAIPICLILGFAAGFVSMYRQLRRD